MVGVVADGILLAAAQRRVELFLTPNEVVGIVAACLVTEDNKGFPPLAGLETKHSPETAKRAMIRDVFLKFMMRLLAFSVLVLVFYELLIRCQTKMAIHSEGTPTKTAKTHCLI